ncbi:hypothetical protein I6F15_29305 [Bradyrhizobium sp. BRP14]|nr:hypothetical protein [Bradyrhizobium sp. BRP14]
MVTLVLAVEKMCSPHIATQRYGAVTNLNVSAPVTADQNPARRPLTHLWYANPNADKRKPGQDLFIAAISIVYDFPVATLNVRNFEQIDGYFPLPGVYNY